MSDTWLVRNVKVQAKMKHNTARLKAVVGGLRKVFSSDNLIKYAAAAIVACDLSNVNSCNILIIFPVCKFHFKRKIVFFAI